MRKVIGCAMIQDKSLVIVRKEKEGKSSWIFPGGKPEQRESDLACLIREIGEELPFLKVVENFEYYGTFRGISPNQGDIIENKVYFYFVKPDEKLDLRVSSNINEPIKEVRQLPYPKLRKLVLSDTASKIIESLRRDLYL